MDAQEIIRTIAEAKKKTLDICHKAIESPFMN